MVYIKFVNSQYHVYHSDTFLAKFITFNKADDYAFQYGKSCKLPYYGIINRR